MQAQIFNYSFYICPWRESSTRKIINKDGDKASFIIYLFKTNRYKHCRKYVKIKYFLFLSQVNCFIPVQVFHDVSLISCRVHGSLSLPYAIGTFQIPFQQYFHQLCLIKYPAKSIFVFAITSVTMTVLLPSRSSPCVSIVYSLFGGESSGESSRRPMSKSGYLWA